MRQKKEKVDKINYIKLVFIFLAVIVVVLILRKWYIANDEYKKSVPVLESLLTHQIKDNEIYNFVSEMNNAVIYMCVAGNEKCRDLEMSMQDFIVEQSLEEVIVYLDLTDVDTKKFFKEFNNYYDFTYDVLSYPTFIYFEDSKIKEVLNKEDTSLNDVKKFFGKIDLLS